MQTIDCQVGLLWSAIFHCHFYPFFFFLELRTYVYPHPNQYWLGQLTKNINKIHVRIFSVTLPPAENCTRDIFFLAPNNNQVWQRDQLLRLFFYVQLEDVVI
jgi:hypothetical protein